MTADGSIRATVAHALATCSGEIPAGMTSNFQPRACTAGFRILAYEVHVGTPHSMKAMVLPLGIGLLTGSVTPTLVGSFSAAATSCRAWATPLLAAAAWGADAGADDRSGE